MKHGAEPAQMALAFVAAPVRGPAPGYVLSQWGDMMCEECGCLEQHPDSTAVRSGMLPRFPHSDSHGVCGGEPERPCRFAPPPEPPRKRRVRKEPGDRR